MGVFQVFKILIMVPNQAKHRKYVWEHTTINYFSHFSINVSVWRYRPLNWKTSDIISSLWICNIANKTKTWTYFSPVLFFIFKPVLSFPVQIKWLVSIRNAILGWNGLTYLTSMFHFMPMLPGILNRMGIIEIKWKISLELVNRKQIPVLSFFFVLFWRWEKT